MGKHFHYTYKEITIGVSIGLALVFGFYLDPSADEAGILFGPFDFWIARA